MKYRYHDTDEWTSDYLIYRSHDIYLYEVTGDYLLFRSNNIYEVTRDYKTYSLSQYVFVVTRDYRTYRSNNLYIR